jgi:hypothetical protein
LSGDSLYSLPLLATKGKTAPLQENPMDTQDVFTVITMYRSDDAEMFTHVVKGVLTNAERAEWRKRFDCDGYSNNEEPNNMFFRTLKPLQSGEMADLFCVDGEEEKPMGNVSDHL